MRIATWNLEWVEHDHRERATQAEVLATIAADLWVLTEARPSVLPEGWESVHSADIPPTGPSRRSVRTPAASPSSARPSCSA